MVAAPVVIWLGTPEHQRALSSGLSSAALRLTRLPWEGYDGRQRLCCHLVDTAGRLAGPARVTVGSASAYLSSPLEPRRGLTAYRVAVWTGALELPRRVAGVVRNDGGVWGFEPVRAETRLELRWRPE